MSKMMVVAALVLLSGCSWETFKADMKSYGNKATVTCYSGDRVVFAGRALGKVEVGEGGNHSFRDSATAQLVEVTGTCVTMVDK